MNKPTKKPCECLPPGRRAFIQSAMDQANGFPDGAFFAFMDEVGIDVSELEVFSDEHDCEADS